MTRRVVVAMTAVVVFAVLLFALPLGVALARRQADQDRRELIKVAALAASRAEATRLRLPPARHRPEREQLVALYARSGHRIDGRGPSMLEPAIRIVMSDRIVDTHVVGVLVVAVPVVDDHGVVAAVRASEPLSTGRARVHRAWLRLGLQALLIDLVAVAVAFGLARRLTRPLAGLVDDATRIGDGDFTVGARMTGMAEVDRVASALTATAVRISDLLAREQAFSSDASHQMRSPLAALRLTVEGELTHPRRDSRSALEEALVEIDRLERTIDELLALAHETSAVRDPIDLTGSVRRLIERWRGPAAAAGRRVVCLEMEPLPPVRVSGEAFSHVLDVLVDNALAHGAGDVEIELRSHHGALSVTVSDHGPGVAHPDRLFIRRQEGAQGNGIGLALARRLTEAEGGRLVLKVNGPSVTTFEVTVPLA